jgi:hypothetical protein
LLSALKIILDGIIRNQYKPGTECVYSGKRNTVKFRDGPAAVIGNICFFNTPLLQAGRQEKTGLMPKVRRRAGIPGV